jgi:DNA-binding MarR family transcriptional regulator
MTKRHAAHEDSDDRGPLLGAMLRRSHQALVAEIAATLERNGHFGALAGYNAVMRPLWDHPDGVRATALATTVGITKQSVGAIVDDLERLGYVERVDDPEDRRAKRIRLTRRGRVAGKLARDAIRRVEADWARRVGATRLEAVRTTLAALLASLDLEA